MLVIAIPKSASTSFVKTLAGITGKESKLIIPSKENDKICNGYEEITKCHCNMKLRSTKYINQVCNGKKTIFREHLIPIEKHLQIVKQIRDPIILLLREPEHIFDCYNRMFDQNGNRKINRRKLKKEIESFFYEWNKIEIDNILKINYNDLVLNYKETMQKVLRHINCVANIKPLQKIKYTGVGEQRLNEKK